MESLLTIVVLYFSCTIHTKQMGSHDEANIVQYDTKQNAKLIEFKTLIYANQQIYCVKKDTDIRYKSCFNIFINIVTNLTSLLQTTRHINGRSVTESCLYTRECSVTFSNAFCLGPINK